MEQIRINIQWRKSHEEDIKEWIVRKLGPSDPVVDVLFAASHKQESS